MLLVVGVVWKVNGRPPISTPSRSQNNWGSSWKWVALTTWGVCRSGRSSKFLTILAVIWAIGWNIHYLWLFWIFYYIFYRLSLRAQVARRAKPPRAPSVPKRVFSMQATTFWRSCWYYAILGDFRGKLIWRSDIGNQIIKKIVNNSKTVRDTSTVCTKH